MKHSQKMIITDFTLCLYTLPPWSHTRFHLLLGQKSPLWVPNYVFIWSLWSNLADTWSHTMNLNLYYELNVLAFPTSPPGLQASPQESSYLSNLMEPLPANQAPALTTQCQARRAMTWITLRPPTQAVSVSGGAWPGVTSSRWRPFQHCMTLCHHIYWVLPALAGEASSPWTHTTAPFSGYYFPVVVLRRKHMRRGQVTSPGSQGQSELWHKPKLLSSKGHEAT